MEVWTKYIRFYVNQHPKAWNCIENNQNFGQRTWDLAKYIVIILYIYTHIYIIYVYYVYNMYIYKKEYNVYIYIQNYICHIVSKAHGFLKKCDICSKSSAVLAPLGISLHLFGLLSELMILDQLKHHLWHRDFWGEPKGTNGTCWSSICFLVSPKLRSLMTYESWNTHHL
jgi:hypothetical protein